MGVMPMVVPMGWEAQRDRPVATIKDFNALLASSTVVLLDHTPVNSLVTDLCRIIGERFK